MERCPLYPGCKRVRQCVFFKVGNVQISVLTQNTGSVTEKKGHMIVCVSSTKHENKVNVRYSTKKDPMSFSIELNGETVPSEAINIGGSSRVLRLSVKNMEFTVSAYQNGFGQIEWHFMSVCRGSANLSVHMGDTTVFYMEQSPDLEKLYNELAHVVFYEYSTQFSITHHRRGFAESLDWPMGKAKWAHGPGNYGLTSEGKSYYVITGVGADGKTNAKFAKIPK